MAIAQEPLTGSVAYPRTVHGTARSPKALLHRAATVLGRMILGSGPGTGVRGYGPREGFPEHELYQIVAGRKDRFDGPM